VPPGGIVPGTWIGVISEFAPMALPDISADPHKVNPERLRSALTLRATSHLVVADPRLAGLLGAPKYQPPASSRQFGNAPWYDETLRRIFTIAQSLFLEFLACDLQPGAFQRRMRVFW